MNDKIRAVTESTQFSWGVVLVLGSLLVWSVRLEGRVNANEKSIDGCPATLGAINERLSRIEGMITEHMRPNK